jgi:DNA-binding response OmpR family regulator
MLEEKVAGYEVGADDYITKPFREDGLRESVEFWLRIGVSVDNNSWALQ